jgi:CO/xanthine dehydrogenase FAD-binding subunit
MYGKIYLFCLIQQTLCKKGKTEMWQQYLFPATVQEALEMLAAHDGQARIIAGGTDLVLQSQRGQCLATAMVDVTRIPGLDAIEEREGYVTIGCQATHARIAASPLIRQKAEVLALACGSVGGPQTRNVGTLVGNVVNALPAADGAVALFALDAEVEVADRDGRRWLPIAEMYAGVGKCAVDPCLQMVPAIRFHPLAGGWASAYQRLANRKALTLPMLNAAVVVGLETGHRSQVTGLRSNVVCNQARIAIGPVAPTPFRAREAEAALVGHAPDAETIALAARLAAGAANPRDSVLRGSRDYRKAMVEVLVRRALTEAATKAVA